MHKAHKKAKNPETGEKFGTGWWVPFPDYRDYTIDYEGVAETVGKLKLKPSEKVLSLDPAEVENPPPLPIPLKKDLRKWCSPIENQGGLGSCTAHAAAGVVEYYQRKLYGMHIDSSRLFIYKTTRNLMGVIGDTGAWLRTTMAALVLCGAAPEKYWPYSDRNPDFDQEPPAFIYALADNYEALRYVCHDPWHKRINPNHVLWRVLWSIARGIPVMFGFYGFPSFWQSRNTGEIPYPCKGENIQWGHAIVAVGYDFRKKIKNAECPDEKTTKGALLIRNSWGRNWGDNGYGWLPFKYVRKRLALDFWSLLDMEWVAKVEDFNLKLERE
jgi:C1A family cysteine protease